MESIDEILNPTESADEQEDETVDSNIEIDDEATGETTQVAAEESDASETPAQIKAELSALAQERARIRQKEAALDEERARLAAMNPAEGTQAEDTAISPRDELKELRKQHRNALMEGAEDADIDALEDRMEELRLSIYNKESQVSSAQERANNEFAAVYAAVHEEYPFLSVDHPDVDQDLNEDINALYLGRLQKGDTQAVALRKAVDKFAPAYAKSHANTANTAARSAESVRKSEADTKIKEKLGKGGFSEVRSASRAEATKPFTGQTPMADILGKAT